MSFTVRIEQFPDSPVTVETGETILEAALAQGLPLPHSCRAGNCGTCKSELLEGDVDLMEHSEFALSEAERAAGKILICRAVPWSDCAVACAGDDELVAHPQRHMNARIVEIERAAHDVAVVRLDVESGGPYAFSAGQYASLEFGALAARDFSMANVPGESRLEFHVRILAGGSASAYVGERAKPGERVRVTGPFGSAYLRDGHAGPMLLAGGGTGFAPLLSIARSALRRDPERSLTLYFGVRDERDLYAERALAELAQHPNVRVERVLSEPREGTRRRTGFVADAVAHDFRDLGGYKAYLAGPPVMVDTTTAVVLERGLTRRDVHADAFVPALAAASDR